MSEFVAYYESILVDRYRNKYIPYSTLLLLLSKAKTQQIHVVSEFYQLLDESYQRSYDYSKEWYERLLHSYPTGNKNINMTIIWQDIQDLNRFVYVNQEALQRILKEHDNVMESKILPFWK